MCDKPIKVKKMLLTQNPWLGKVVPGILRKPPHQDIVLFKETLPPLKEAGAKESIGEPQGQMADFRIALSDGRSIYIKEFDLVFKVHWGWFNPTVDWRNRLIYDAPHWWILLTTVVGWVIGYFWNREFEESVAGAFYGLVLGMITSKGLVD